MPELPEVETTVLSLKQKVLNKTFVSIWTEEEKDNLKSLVKKKIVDIKRYGKGIYIFLDDKKILFIHLRMTGHLLLGAWDFRNKEKSITGDVWESKDKILQDKKNKYLRFVFLLDDGKQLALSDPRKFAKVEIITEGQKEEKIKKLGPDPLELKKEEFVSLISKKKGKIKPLLMKQEFLSGIGNIYATEALFLSKINPSEEVGKLKKEEIENIYIFLQKLLKKSLQLKGDSTSDYRLLTGEKGGYQNYHLVYNRKDLLCNLCKSKIKRSVVGGRGSYYCPSCQKLK